MHPASYQMPADALHLQRQSNCAEDIVTGKESFVTSNDPDPSQQPACVSPLAGEQWLSQQTASTGLWLEFTGNKTQQGCLAGAGRTGNAQCLTLSDAHRKISQ
jgi:hypothetical protein